MCVPLVIKLLTLHPYHLVIILMIYNYCNAIIILCVGDTPNTPGDTPDTPADTPQAEELR